MSRRLTLEDCDLILKGAVVLACGGGGPLHFAREILEEIDEDEYACVEPPELVGDEDWMAMIALVGTPSKVHRRSDSPQKVRQRRMSPWNASPFMTSPWNSPQSSPRASPVPGGLLSAKSMTKSLDNLDEPRPQSPRPSFYELVKHVMRVKFLCTSAPRFEDSDAKTPCNAARNTFLYLQKQCQLRSTDYNHYPRFHNFSRFKYLLTGELGAVNMATALYLSAVNKVKIVDGDGAGRSVPLVNQITYADNFSCSPTAIMSSHPGPDFDSIPSTVLDFPQGNENMVEEVAAALISDENGPFSPFIGYGSYVINGEQMSDIPVYGSYTTALAVGRAIDEFQGYERAAAVSRVLSQHGRPNQIVFQGKVTEKILQDSKVKDTGFLIVTSPDGDKMKLCYKNEIILAGRPGQEPLYMAPDSICILPSDQIPMDISSIPDPKVMELDIYVLIVQADDKIKSQKVIKSFENIYRVFKHGNFGSSIYQSCYKEWYPSDESSYHGDYLHSDASYNGDYHDDSDHPSNGYERVSNCEHVDCRSNEYSLPTVGKSCQMNGFTKNECHSFLYRNNNNDPPLLGSRQPEGIIKVQATSSMAKSTYV